MAATMGTFWSNTSPRPEYGRDRSAAREARTAPRMGDGGDPSRGSRGTDRLRVLVANAPLSYRETMAATIRMLRPNVEVLLVNPEALDREVESLYPDMVLCSRVTPLVESRVSVWVDLYPDGDRLATVSIGGRRTETAGLELDDLLSIIDRRVRNKEVRG